MGPKILLSDESKHLLLLPRAFLIVNLFATVWVPLDNGRECYHLVFKNTQTCLN